MIIKLFTAIFLISLIVSCSSVHNTGVRTFVAELPSRNNSINSLEMKSKLTAQFGEDINSVNSKIYISGADSVTMSLIGPFGVALGKLYADKNYFQFYNIFESTVIEGVPNEENFRKAVSLNVSFSDFVQIARCVPPGNLAEYKLFSTDSVKMEALYRRQPSDSTAEYVLLSLRDGNILQFQRKSQSGAIIINAFFRDYVDINGFFLAGKIVMDFPEANASLTIESSGHILNGKLPAMRFSVPDGIKRIYMK